MYNPNAVVNAMINKSFQSYWSQTGTYESIVPFINMNFDGLKTAVIEMLSGSTTQINVNSFQNDMVNFVDKDDVLDASGASWLSCVQPEHAVCLYSK